MRAWARANEQTWLGLGADYRDELGLGVSTPLDQAYPLVYLCSDAARAVSGVTLVSDAGYFAAGATGSYESAILMAQLLYGRAVDGVVIPDTPDSRP